MEFKRKRVLEWAAIIALVVATDMPGEPPAIAGQTWEGRFFELAQLRGRPSIIYFWASGCPVCRGMRSSVSAIAKDYPLISVALQSGTRAELGKYQQEQDFHIPTVSDEDGATTGRSRQFSFWPGAPSFRQGGQTALPFAHA